MALIDVSNILLDPDFTNKIKLIRRFVTVNEHGENVISETASYITAVVQGNNTETLQKLPAGALLSDVITVYYRGTLTAERAGGYADIIIWSGKRYQVKDVVEDFLNFGAGFTKALCILEAVNA